MQDRELYQHLLGLCTPWTVANVALDIEAEEIVVVVEHPRDTKFRGSRRGDGFSQLSASAQSFSYSTPARFARGIRS